MTPPREKDSRRVALKLCTSALTRRKRVRHLGTVPAPDRPPIPGSARPGFTQQSSWRQPAVACASVVKHNDLHISVQQWKAIVAHDRPPQDSRVKQTVRCIDTIGRCKTGAPVRWLINAGSSPLSSGEVSGHEPTTSRFLRP
jgi:hypothetical protein